MNIEEGCVVSISYRLTTDEGDLIDQSTEGQPLVYVHGAKGIVPALEAELRGKVEGDEFDVLIDAAEAYGEYDPHAVKVVSRSVFPADVELQLGMQVESNHPNVPKSATVIGLNNDGVTIDANHPLAGLTLRFVGQVLGVRQATAEELNAN